MANLQGPVRIGSHSNNTKWIMHHVIGNFNTTSGSFNYIHFKTNIGISTECIFTIEAEGYNYGTSSPVLCAWGVYTTGSGVTLKGLESSSGLTAHGIYVSSDGKVCIRAYSGNPYYLGIVLHLYSHISYPMSPPSILAANLNNNSGSYY